MMEITRAAGSIGIPRLYVTEDPGAVDAAAKAMGLSISEPRKKVRPRSQGAIANAG
jgi:hypothetical protein